MIAVTIILRVSPFNGLFVKLIENIIQQDTFFISKCNSFDMHLGNCCTRGKRLYRKKVQGIRRECISASLKLHRTNGFLLILLIIMMLSLETSFILGMFISNDKKYKQYFRFTTAEESEI